MLAPFHNHGVDEFNLRPQQIAFRQLLVAVFFVC